MEFETEMKRLTTELKGAFENRMTAVREARTNNQTARGAMAAEQQQHLHQQMNDLRHRTADYMNRTVAQLDQLRTTNAAFMQALGNKRAEMSAAQRDQLRTTNAAFMQALGNKRAENSTAQHDHMQALGNKRAEMSAAQRDRLTTARAQLTADMTVMRQGMQVAQAALHADQAAGHAEWLRFTEAKVGNQMADAQPAPRPEPAQPVMATPPMATPVMATPPIPDHATSDVEDEKKKVI